MASSDVNEIILSFDSPSFNYSDGWAQYTMPFGDVPCAQAPGISVSLTYTYESIDVLALYIQTPPEVSITLDGTQHLATPPDYAADSSLQPYHSWSVLHRTGLPLENHTIEISVGSGVESSPSNLCLRSIRVGAPQQLFQLVATSQAADSTTAPAAGATNSASTPASSSKSQIHVGTIVGAVIGGVAMTILICGLLFWWYRREHKYMRTAASDDDESTSSYGKSQRSPVRPFSLFGGFRRKRFFEARPPVSHLEWHSAPVNSSCSPSEKTATFSSIGLATPTSEAEALAQSRRVPLYHSHTSLRSLDSRSYARQSVFPSGDTVSDMISPTLNRTPTADSERASALDGAESSTHGIDPASRSSRDSIADFAHSLSRDSTHGGHSSRHRVSDNVLCPTPRSATT